MAMVFVAEDIILQRPVALKVMSPDLVQSDVAHSERASQRFLREARAMARLRNDHIVTIFEVGQEGAYPFLAMELLRGEPLDAWLRKNQPTPDRVVQMGVQIAHALVAAHKAGLIHRDIKPANIWVEEPYGRVKVLDFGLARQQRLSPRLWKPLRVGKRLQEPFCGPRTSLNRSEPGFFAELGPLRP
jgi:serine/threonine protein kinase